MLTRTTDNHWHCGSLRLMLRSDLAHTCVRTGSHRRDVEVLLDSRVASAVLMYRSCLCGPLLVSMSLAAFTIVMEQRSSIAALFLSKSAFSLDLSLRELFRRSALHHTFTPFGVLGVSSDHWT